MSLAGVENALLRTMWDIVQWRLTKALFYSFIDGMLYSEPSEPSKLSGPRKPSREHGECATAQYHASRPPCMQGTSSIDRTENIVPRMDETVTAILIDADF